MNTRQPDHTTYREWLYLESDGELNAGERSKLKEHLGACASCRAEREEVLALGKVLADSKFEVGEDFTRRVMTDLPPAGWEARSARAWFVAVAAVLVLAIASALLIGTAGEEASSSVPVAALAAVWELLTTSALAGAGLLTASWKGLGLAIQDVLGRSIWNLIAFGVLVLCLDILLLRFLLRDRAVEATPERPRDS